MKSVKDSFGFISCTSEAKARRHEPHSPSLAQRGIHSFQLINLLPSLTSLISSHPHVPQFQEVFFHFDDLEPGANIQIGNVVVRSFVPAVAPPYTTFLHNTLFPRSRA